MATTEIAVPQATPRAKTGSIKAQRFIGKTIALLLLSAGAILFMMPLVWMLTTALKTVDAATSFPPQWIPERRD